MVCADIHSTFYARKTIKSYRKTALLKTNFEPFIKITLNENKFTHKKIDAICVTSHVMLKSVIKTNIFQEVCVKKEKKRKENKARTETKNLINDNEDILKGDTFTHTVFDSFASVTYIRPHFLK